VSVISKQAIFKMKTLLLIYFTLLTGMSAFSQKNDIWTAFWEKESQLRGFKNSNDEVMIEPKFMGITSALEFDNIIAVMEEKEGEYKSYYLTKSGKKVGFDSLYIFDNGADCESDGFIRFKDKETDKVGMFDKDGTIVIPAVYNSLSRAHNGLIRALKGAEKKQFDNEYYNWEGGEEVLLSIKNQVLVDNFQYDGTLDFYTLSIEEGLTKDSSKVSFKGVNGKYYTFHDTEKDFREWLTVDLLQNFTKNKLLDSSMDSLVYWKEESGTWVSEHKNEFVNRNFNLLKNRISSFLTSSSDNFISNHELNSFIFTGESYQQYFNTCGEAKKEKYPAMTLIINEKTNGDLVQDHIQFLKTKEGYRLISISITSKKIK